MKKLLLSGALAALVPAVAQANPLSDRLLTYPPATQASMLGQTILGCVGKKAVYMATTANIDAAIWLVQCAGQEGHDGYVLRITHEGNTEALPCADFQRRFGIGCYFGDPPENERTDDPHAKALQALAPVQPDPLAP
jgi:hypothetical protein